MKEEVGVLAPVSSSSRGRKATLEKTLSRQFLSPKDRVRTLWNFSPNSQSVSVRKLQYNTAILC